MYGCKGKGAGCLPVLAAAAQSESKVSGLTRLRLALSRLVASKFKTLDGDPGVHVTLVRSVVCKSTGNLAAAGAAAA